MAPRTSLIILLLLIAPSFAWYYSGFGYRMPINISYPSYLQDVQVLLVIPYNSHMRSDYSDLRFTFLNGSAEVEVPFWIESYNSENVSVWVRVPELNSSTLLYVYYNHPSAPSASMGEDTFIFFDDFEGDVLNRSKWVADVGLVENVSNSTLYINQLLGIYHYFDDLNLWNNYVMETRAAILAPPGTSGYGGVYASPMSSPYTQSNNRGMDATLLYFSSGTNNNLQHYFGSGCWRAYDIHYGTLPFTVEFNSYYIMGIETRNIGGGTFSISLYMNRTQIHTDTASRICKSLKYVRLGHFERRSSSTQSKVTAYDWVLIRKYYDMSALTYTIGAEEEGGFVRISITHPADGSYVTSPIRLTFTVNASDPADVYVYVNNSTPPAYHTYVEEGFSNITTTLSLDVGPYTISVVGNSSDVVGRDEISIVVLSSSSTSSSGGGGSVCYSCIARKVWSYKNRTLTSSQLDEIKEGLQNMRGELNAVNTSLINIEQGISSLEGRLVSLNTSFGKLEEELTKLFPLLEESQEGVERVKEKLGEITEYQYQTRAEMRNVKEKLSQVQQLQAEIKRLEEKLHEVQIVITVLVAFTTLASIYNLYLLTNLLKRKR